MSDAAYIPANEIDELANGWDEGVLIARSHAVVLAAAQQLAEALRNRDECTCSYTNRCDVCMTGDAALARFDALGGTGK